MTTTSTDSVFGPGFRAYVDLTPEDVSEILQRATYAQAPVAMSIVSAESQRIVAMNPGFEELIGRDAGRLLGQRAVDHLVERDRAGFLHLLARFAAGEPGIVRINRPVGTDRRPDDDVTAWLVPCQLSFGVAVLILVLVHPSTGTAAIGAAVETFEPERLAPLPGAMAMVTDAQWRIRSLCPQFARALGRSIDEVAGSRLADVVHWQDLGFVVAAVVRGEGAASPSTALDVRFRGHRGEWRTFACSAAPLHARSGFDGIVITAFTHSQLHASMMRVATLASEIQQTLEGATEQREQGPRNPRSVSDARLLGLLSSREREILELVAGGLRVATIADRLYIAPGTVRNHLSSIFQKLGVSSQAQLTEWLVRRHGDD